MFVVLLVFVLWSVPAWAAETRFGAFIPAFDNVQEAHAFSIRVGALPGAECPLPCLAVLQLTFDIADGAGRITVQIGRRGDDDPGPDSAIMWLVEDDLHTEGIPPTRRRIGRLARGEPLLLVLFWRGADPGPTDQTRVVFAWEGRSKSFDVPLPFNVLSSITIEAHLKTPGPTVPEGFLAAVRTLRTPPVIDLIEDPAGAYNVELLDHTLTLFPVFVPEAEKGVN